jgi:hypothetical protein
MKQYCINNVHKKYRTFCKVSFFFSELFRLSFGPLFHCFQFTFMAGFRNNQDHKRLSEQLLESQAAIGEPEQLP